MTYWRNNLVLLAVCLLGTGIGLVHSSITLAQSSGLVKPLTAIDLNPDPDVIEIQLVAQEAAISFGTENMKEVYAYNGSIPGPTIEGKIGDTLIVHFTNLLPEPTTIHWHGLELPANMDGSHIAQHPVPAGGTFRYEFKFLRASTFWYHPHIRTNEQVEKGLYGMMVVRDPDEDQSLGLPVASHELVLDDVLLDENGQISEPFPTDPLENAETQVNGRIGNTLLVNGEPDAVGMVDRGVPQRLRLVNTANARFMRVSIAGHRMFRIGGDGGLLEAPIEIQPVELIADPDDPSQLISDPDPTKGLLLTPGERADVVFTPGGENSTIAVEWHDIARGRQQASFATDGTIVMSVDETDGKRPPRTLLTLELIGETDGDEFVPEAVLRDIESIDVTGAKPIPVTFGHSRPDANGDSTFFVFQTPGMPMPFELITPEVAPLVTVGDTRIWEIRNVTAGDHNFHSHGFTFQLIDTRFEDEDNPGNNFTIPAAYLEDKDTILLPGRPGERSRSRTVTRLAATFHDTGREGKVEAFGKVPGDNTSGGWVFHCHILEHADRGMMSFLQVMNPPVTSDFEINSGLNDAWMIDGAPFQGMVITVFPVLKLFFVAWFTFDSEQPPENVTAVFGAPGQRWVTAMGFYDGNRAELKAELTTGGSFNASGPIPVQDTQYGTMVIEFSHCNLASVEFDFPDPGESDFFTMTRIVESNVSLCEQLNAE
jgi:FtsP/CotA-like multicopper oxidase with cupredoxin domain